MNDQERMTQFMDGEEPNISLCQECQDGIEEEEIYCRTCREKYLRADTDRYNRAYHAVMGEIGRYIPPETK